MFQVLCPVGDQPAAAPAKSGFAHVRYQSFWVIVGFTFWFGFYLGAVIMHAATK